MNTKVATIFLVFCAVHGLQAQLWPRPSSIFRPRPSIFSNSLSGARFPNCFLNALNAIAQAQLGMNQVAQDAINQGTPQDIALRCVREQQAFLQDFSKNLTDRVTQISNGVAQTEGLEDIAPELTAELENLASTISSTPGKAAELLDNGNMKEAAAIFQAARDQVTVHVNKLKDIVEERFGKDSEFFQEADKLGNEILYTGYTNAQKLIANVQQCIKDRTPA